MITKAVKLSSPDVGSSKKSRVGSLISSNAMEVRFLSPPEIPFIITLPIKVSLQSSN